MLIAYVHRCRNGATHLRVTQSLFSEHLKAKLQRIGSPARWIPAEQAWDCPNSPASVVRLGEIAKEVGEVIEWRDGLQEYADEHLKRNDFEHEVRMAMERILQSKQILDPYVTLMNRADGSLCPPLWHQTASYHWSIRVRGLLLAHDPGVGKTRSACDASGGWYRLGQIQPMQPQVIDGKPGVSGGVLVVSPKTMLKTWQEELVRWQNAHGVIIAGEAGKKARLAGTPAHYHIVNYEGLRYVTHNRYQGVVFDECFVAGTPVWTTTGPKPVETVAAGDQVFAYDHANGEVVVSIVKQTMASKPKGVLVKVTTKHDEVVCTEGHPWHNDAGYTPAIALQGVEVSCYERLHYLWETRQEQGMRRGVPEGCDLAGAPPGEAVALRMPCLQEGSADRARDWANTGDLLLARVLPRGADAGVLGRDEVCGVRGAVHPFEQVSPIDGMLLAMPGQADGESPRGVEPQAWQQAHAGEQPNGEARGAGEGVRHAPCDEAPAARPRGERAAADEVGAAAGEGAGCGVGGEPAREDRRLSAEVPRPRLLEGGCGLPHAEGGRGGGWWLARESSPPGAGRAKDGVLDRARVDRVEVQERGGGDESGKGSGDGALVYNLEVEGHHNYFVGRVPHLVHNCHKLANHTQQTDNALTISERALKRLGLTGTPIANDLKSIFYPMLILDGGRALGPSRTAFLEKYFNSSRNFAGFAEYEAKDDAATEIAKAIATSTYFVKKEECLDLPAKTHTPIYLPMTPEQARYYQSVKNEAISYIQDATVTIEQASARCMKLLQICQGFALVDARDGEEKGVDGRHFTDAKTEALMDMLTDQLRGKKVIIWTLFKYETKRLVEALEKEGISYIRIDGTVKSQRERDAAKDRWNSDPTVTVFVRQLSMSEGVTLLGTDDVPCYTTIYLSLNYSMTSLLQSMDRVHRIGQHHQCDYIYLLTENGIDRSVYARLLEKVENANKIISTGKNWYRELLLAAAA
jgi:hypothetical protein